LVYGCAKLPFALAKTSIQTHFHLQSYYPQNKEATDNMFFGLWMCKRKLEQIPFCTCQNPNPNTLSSSQLLPTNKECACTGPEAELYKLDVLHSARAAHAQCKLQCTATKRCKYHGVRVFWAIYTKKQTHCLFCAFSSFLFLGKHMVFTAFCGRALCFGLHTHKPKNISVASLFGG